MSRNGWYQAICCSSERGWSSFGTILPLGHAILCKNKVKKNFLVLISLKLCNPSKLHGTVYLDNFIIM